MAADLFAKLLIAAMTIGVSIHIYRSTHKLNQKKHNQDLKNRILDLYQEHKPQSIQDDGFKIIHHSFFDYTEKHVDPKALLLVLKRDNQPNLFSHLAISAGRVCTSTCGYKFKKIEAKNILIKFESELSIFYLAASILIFGYPFFEFPPVLLNAFEQDPSFGLLLVIFLFYFIISVPLFHSTSVASKMEAKRQSIKYLTNQANN